jgi:hypothetical protein
MEPKMNIPSEYLVCVGGGRGHNLRSEPTGWSRGTEFCLHPPWMDD